MNSTRIDHLQVTFSWVDYLIFLAMLITSSLIGIYFGFFAKSISTVKNYLLGGRKMKSVPIAMSLIACHVSTISFLAVPADVFQYGASYVWTVLALVIACVATVFIYLPVFYELQLTSIYEYLERRFDSKTRQLGSFLCVVDSLLFLPLVLYTSSLAFSTVSGINVYLVVVIISGVCIFYTTLGGLKSVVWTDILQMIIMTATVLIILVLGLVSVGGPEVVWNKAKDSGRLNIFDFNLDLAIRDNFWSIVLGMTVNWLGRTCVNQSCVLKFSAVPTFRDCIIVAIVAGFGLALFQVSSTLQGLVIYAKFSNCDPLSNQQIQKKDQLVPYYVLNTMGNVIGLPGIFIAGILSAGLSTFSTNLNSLAGVIYKDFVSKLWRRNISEETVCTILKCIVLATGILCTLLVFVVSQFDGLFQLASSIGGLAIGPQLGIFSLGVLVPKVNSKGAFYGGLAGMASVACIMLPAKYYEHQKLFSFPSKPFSTDGCVLGNETIPDVFYSASVKSNTMPPFLFRVSFYYYPFIGAAVTIILGLIISCLTKGNDLVDKNLITPVCRRFLPQETARHPLMTQSHN